MRQVIVSLQNGKPICFPVEQHNTTLDLKNHIYSATSIPVDDQVLRTLDGHYLHNQAHVEVPMISSSHYRADCWVAKVVLVPCCVLKVAV
ncbi:hypothetical protein BD560DRAFT_463662 [Blakeslea trispora]|nr:hypothetical protein BD560DRAFT_463662 [Blakeslea trispora]